MERPSGGCLCRSLWFEVTGAPYRVGVCHCLDCSTTAPVRHRPERTALYDVVRDNLETLYGAIDDGALDVRVPKHARKELEGYLDRGLLCRGLARLVCEACGDSRVVAWSCKGRGFCPSCLGRRMCASAANLIEHVLPAGVPLRQWVLTFPHAWRSRLAHDGALLGRLTRLFLQTVEALYARRACERVAGTKASAKSGAVTVVQRTSSDMRANPHLHSVFLDGVYREQGDAERELGFHPLAHVRTRDVGEVLERAVVRMLRHVTRSAHAGRGAAARAGARSRRGGTRAEPDRRGRLRSRATGRLRCTRQPAASWN